MHTLTAADPETRSADIVGDNLVKLRELFPEAFTEGRVDFDVLRGLLGDAVDEREEKYGLNWHGQRRARQLALTPSAGTLRPCREESVDWESTRNLMIEGDNLEVLKLLQKSYTGKVKMIYIDPPYNTGNDFIYPDDFRDTIHGYLSVTGQLDSEARAVSSNPETSGRYHTDWLNMMLPRLRLGRNLLSSDGAIFVSIDDNEVSRLRLLCDEVFGEENFIAVFVRRRRMATGMRGQPISPDHEYVVAYAKDLQQTTLYGFARNEDDFPLEDTRSQYRSTDLTVGMTREMRPNQYYAIRNPRSGAEYWPPEERVWRFEPATMSRHIEADNIIWPDERDGGRMSRPRFKTRYGGDEDEKTNPVSTWIPLPSGVSKGNSRSKFAALSAGLNQEATKELRDLFGEQILEYPKPVSLVSGLCAIATRRDDLILDFFAGSGTTGHAVWELNQFDGGNRRFILVQLPEPIEHSDYRHIADITKERLRRAAKQIESEPSGSSRDLGFRVFKLDSSNIRAWEPEPEDIERTLESSVEHLKAGRTEQDVLYELLLKMGLDLAVPIETREIAGKTVHSVGAGTLLVCLTDGIARDEAEPLALGIAALHGELAPEGESHAVFRDSAFADDVAKTNLTAILHQHGIEHVRSI